MMCAMSVVGLHDNCIQNLFGCGNEEWRNSTGIRPRAHSRHEFKECCEVLARWSDGLSYLGIVVEVDNENQRCLVNFEDNSLHWILYKDLQTGTMQTDEITCAICDGEKSETPNEIVICDRCNRGYHQLCHRPSIPDNVLNPDVQWHCRQCIFASTAKKGGARKKGPDAKEMKVMKQSLPYNLNTLTWDAHHKTNIQQCYCYCGGSGEWYKKMLQCCRCKQWFHEACLQCLERPLLYGDRFYIFVCSICNSNQEYLHRMELKWVDVTHLLLFNLTVEHNKKYFDFNSVIVPYILKKWHCLQIKGKLFGVREDVKKDNILLSLRTNKNRFICGREIKKKGNLWGLRNRVPPPVPTITIPAVGPVNDEVMEELKRSKQHKTKMFIPVNNTPIPIKKGKRRKSITESESLNVTQRSARARVAFEDAIRKGESDCVPLSPNQSYCGYTGSASACTVLDSDFPTEDISFNTLDVIIPPPLNFEGLNHPFWDLNWPKGQNTSLCPPVKRKLSKEDIRVSKNGEIKRRYRRRNHFKAARIRWSNGQTSEGSLDTGSESETIMEMIKKEPQRTQICHRELRSSKNNCSSASDRIANGEKFRVRAKRVTSDGKIQYLVEWGSSAS